MNTFSWRGCLGLGGVALALGVPARALDCVEGTQHIQVTGAHYQVRFEKEQFGVGFCVRDAAGAWQNVFKPGAALEFGFGAGEKFDTTAHARVVLTQQRQGTAIVVGARLLLDALDGVGATAEFICTDDGVLLRFKPAPREALPAHAQCWALPRLALDERRFDAYSFWAADGRRHDGRLEALAPMPAYAGVSAWGRDGDVAPRLAPQLPAVIARSEKTGVGMGVVLVDAAGAWREGQTFLQRYRPDTLFLYAGNARAAVAQGGAWGWLAPFDGREAVACEKKVAQLLAQTGPLLKAFRPVAALLPAHGNVTPDVSMEQRRAQPVADMADAMVFTMNEEINSPYGMALARKTCSEVLIRAWFKWHNAPDWSRYRQFPVAAHQFGMLFGGGITCSALYDGENGLTAADVADMATRNAAGELVNAWDTPGCHHGSLSSPRYLDYLLRWCRAQLDQGADYLFMDEHNAVLQGNEGFDDHSNRAFREWLQQTYLMAQGWSATDTRWRTTFGLDVTDRALCPDGSVASFDYRAWLRKNNLLADPHAPRNSLAPAWQMFRRERDDRAWKQLCDGIRAYAASKGRQVFISANGCAPYVDLQVLGVWGRWLTHSNRVDIGDSQLTAWAGTVRRGRALAGREVPVVLFHDWGFGTPPFPWMAVPPADRELWMRVRAAEIYAAGGRFAFPVTGPFGCDALKDGTLGAMAHLMCFYRDHAALYRHTKTIACDALPAAPDLGTALALRTETPALILHLINHATRDRQLVSRTNICVDLPVKQPPARVTVASPDGACTARLEQAGAHLRLCLDRLEAYAVVELSYPALPTLTTNFSPHVVPENRWGKPARNMFAVRPGGEIAHEQDLITPLQGRLHQQLRNPPTFVINAPHGGQLLVHVRAVATAGARLVLREGAQTLQTVDLPDRDGRNDSSAREWDRTFTFALPAGQHRLTLDNTGGDWAALDWLSFSGDFAEPPAGP